MNTTLLNRTVAATLVLCAVANLAYASGGRGSNASQNSIDAIKKTRETTVGNTGGDNGAAKLRGRSQLMNSTAISTPSNNVRPSITQSVKKSTPPAAAVRPQAAPALSAYERRIDAQIAAVSRSSGGNKDMIIQVLNSLKSFKTDSEASIVAQTAIDIVRDSKISAANKQGAVDFLNGIKGATSLNSLRTLVEQELAERGKSMQDALTCTKG